MNIKQMQQMMKQAQKMQDSMGDVQKEIDDKLFTGTAGGGVVEVVMKGTKEVEKVTIDENLLDKEEKDILEDMIKIATNQALEAIQKETEEKMGPLTQGMGLPF